jgi:diacylglycerol kinase (ATP)
MVLRMPGIGIIHNPFARGNLNRPGVAEKLRRILGDEGIVVETRNIAELPQIAEKFLQDGIEIIAVNGGDGTLHLTLSAFIKVYGDRPLPRLISLRGGTMNTMSTSLKLRGKTLEICRLAVEHYQRGEPFELMDQPLVRIADKYGFMSGGGLATNFLEAYYSGTNTGPIEGVKVVGKCVVSALTGTDYAKKLFALAQADIVVDGETVPFREFTAILGCSIVEIGLGFKPTPRAYDRPGHFHFIATRISPLGVISRLHLLHQGKDIIHPDFFSRVARQAEIRPKGKFRYTIDGELYDTEEPLTICAGPVVKVVKI